MSARRSRRLHLGGCAPRCRPWRSGRAQPSRRSRRTPRSSCQRRRTSRRADTVCLATASPGSVRCLGCHPASYRARPSFDPIGGRYRPLTALGSLFVPALTPHEIGAIDAAHIWHPYGPVGAPALAPVAARALPPVVALGARGAARTVIRQGRPVEVLDAMSSWWTAIHGHAHPALDAAIAKQLATMNHGIVGGLTHEPA